MFGTDIEVSYREDYQEIDPEDVFDSGDDGGDGGE